MLAREDSAGWTSVIAAVAGMCIGLPGAWAQRAPVADPLARFAAERLPSQAVAGGLGMAADVATVWTEQTAAGLVQRVVLDHAVQLEIGGSSFEAERAVLWIRTVPGEDAKQVFAHLESVGARQGPPSSSAEELTISGVVRGPVRLVAGAVRERGEGPSTDKGLTELVARADEALRSYYEPKITEAPTRGRRAFSRSNRVPARWPDPLPKVELAVEDAGEPEGAADEQTPTAPPRRVTARRPTPPPGAVVSDSSERRPADGPVASADEPSRQGREGESAATSGATTPATPRPAEMAPTDGRSAGAPAPGVVPAMEPRSATIPARTAKWPPASPDSAAVPGARLRDAEASRGRVLPESRSDLGTILLPGQGDLGKAGVLTFSAEDIAVVGSQNETSERTILMSGGVGMELSKNREQQGLTMTAQRAVVFLTPGTLAELGRVSREDVVGIYLEGEAVMQDDRSTQRGSRLYYDVAADRAMVLDAAMSTRDPRSGVPLYVRADTVRKEGERQFVATRATVANTSFARPHFAIGSREVTIEQYQRQVGDDIVTGNRVDARNLTLEAGSVPVLWFPRWVGDPERVPLRGLGFDSSSTEGFAVKTAWDAWVLAGIEPPTGVETELLVDVYEKRGLGLGTFAKWKRPTFEGNVFGYILPNDDGVDDLRTGEEVDVGGELRGTVIAENRWDIDNNWTLRLEGAHVSDPRLLESVFDEEFRDRRELTTRGVLTRRGEQTLFEVELANSFDDFLTNEYLLQSRGYTVDRLPEIRFTRLTADPLRDFAPGLLTYNAEVRGGMLGLNFDDVRASERGMERTFQSMSILGVTPEMSVGDRLRTEGFNEKEIWRFDTRHELAMPLHFGADDAINVTPFVVGRMTTYDTSFSGYSPDEEDRTRLWGAAGVRLSTTISRTDDGIESRTLDLHRLRHVLEPGITLWHAGTSIEQDNLPVYDEEVESLVEGTMLRVGLDQKWQTQRGGPGRWRSVDVLTLRTEWVWSSDDVDEQSPIGRYFEDRPEYSNPGEFYNIEALWQVSEAVGLAGRLVHDIDNRESSYITGGVVLDHGGEFYTSFDVRRVEAIDATVLGTNASFALTSKYRAFTSANYDTVQGDFERITAGVERSFPNVSLRGSIRHDSVRGDTSFGFTLAPKGVPGGGFGFSGVGGEEGSRSVGQ